jgi:predicted Zn-ribbon and HTH transcriptional regulator
MADTEVRMDWGNPNKAEAMALFKQQCLMIFRRKKIKTEDQVDEILLRTGVTGIKKFNSWGLSEADAKNPDVVWKKFLEYGETTQNFRIARLALRTFKQKVNGTDIESVEDFMARCRLQAQVCDFKPEEISERLIEQLIAGTAHPDVQKELLSQEKTMTLEQAMQISGRHEASLSHMKQLAETQMTSSVNAVQRSKKCQKCGTSHALKPRDACPAYGTKCYECGRMNHWGNMCRNKPHSDQQHKSKPQGREKQYKHQPKFSNTYNRGSKKYHSVQEDEYDEEEDEEYDDEVVFSMVKVSEDNRDEIFAKVMVNIPGQENLKTSILAKVDTGAQGNILPTRVFKKMKIPADRIKPCNTVLTAYNGSDIPQEGKIELQCKYEDGKWSSESFYVADTTGPIILGLPSCRALNLVSLHCAVQTSPVHTVNNTADLVKMYPEQFDRIGHFPGKYHIVLKPDAEPVVHAPRKCPIHLRNELKKRTPKDG